MSKEKFYIATAIAYPSAGLHVGHTYEAVSADVIARYKRMRGYDVMFLTGTDEHGEKIEEKAKAAGITPQAFVDNIVLGERGVKDLYALMNISYSRFIRTTDDYHVSAIQKIFRELYERGDIYKGAYRGKYCRPDESFWTESQLIDGKCPICGREVYEAEEEAYFFRLSAYADRIKTLLENGLLEPAHRATEMINNFINPGLEDLCVSRTSVKWGIPVDFDPSHVVYVWIDALFNYMTALGYQNDRYDDMRYWPCDIHVIGKDIVRFHAIIWPAFLMALSLPLPKLVFGHGFVNMKGEKLSKSTGNVVDPYVLAEKYGTDALRFFLIRDFPYGSDGDYAEELLVSRINTDLANDFGNLVSRTAAMAHKYFGGTLPEDHRGDAIDTELISAIDDAVVQYAAQLDKLALQNAAQEALKLSSRANKYIDETAPWKLAKDQSQKARLAAVLYNLLEAVRVTATLLHPIIPAASEKVLAQLGFTGAPSWDDAKYGVLPLGAAVTKGDTLFPRVVTET